MPTVTAFDVQAVRAHFPSLARQVDGHPLVYLDGPGGTQVPDLCLDGIRDYLTSHNTNTHGAFPTSVESDALLAEAHAAAADFLGAAPDEVAFGANATTITFAMSRAIGRTLQPGDEVVVTRLDHDCNVAPWLALQEDRGVTIRWVDVRPEDCTLDLAGLEQALGPRTRLVAVGLASNAVGTINPVRRIADAAHAVGAQVWVDAVHGAPHLPIDVVALGADYLVCSPYKFFGPHMGLFWGRHDLLEALPVYKVRPAEDTLPSRLETGTQSHEAQAGLLGTFQYLEWLGATQGEAAGAGSATDGGPQMPDAGRWGSSAGPEGADAGRRGRLRAAMRAIRAYELTLTPRLLDGLATVPGLRIRGITDASRLAERCPTVAFTLEGHHPREVSQALGNLGISTWDGDYYAYELIRSLGLAESGGMVRVGLAHYNTAHEIDELVGAVGDIARG
ncbi:MAG: aminotransferase class V-fold PLP-dependent enzyme [Candidatus Limnocylindrales bacterium]